MEAKNTTEALLYVEEKVCYNSFINQLRQYEEDAKRASSMINQVEIVDVFDLGVSDTLVKMKRNALALPYLLSLAADASEYMKNGIHIIFEARDNAEKEKEKRRKEALRREHEYKVKKKQNDRYRKKISDNPED